MPRASSRTVLAWLAAFSLLLNGMLPLAQAVPAAMPAMAICSTAVVSADGKAPLPAPAHCLVCCSASQLPALPAVAMPTVLRQKPTMALPPAAPLAATTPSFHRPPSRAPPRA